MTTETQTPIDDSRLSAIEAVMPHLATKEDIAILPHLATKEDVAKLETKLVETKNEMLLWMAGMFTAAVVTLGLLITLMGLLVAD